MAEEQKTFALSALSAGFANLIDGVSKSVVAIHGSRRRDAASAFIWRQGLVVTADEALGHHSGAVVAAGGQQHEASILGRDPSTDIAVLKIEGLSAPALTLSPAIAPRTGEIVFAIGSRDQETTARFGIVSQSGPAWRSMRGGRIDSLIRLDLTLDRRGEGGPVIDSEGRVFGMAVRGPRRSVLAIPAATIERVAAQIVEKGSIRPGYLGLGLHPVRIRAQGQEPGMGLMVLGVAEGAPGHGAGVLQGDIITGWNAEPLAGMRDVMRRLNSETVGQTVELSLNRAGQPIKVQCLIGARPEA